MSGSNLALIYKGGWWYSGFYYTHLNGLYLHGKVSRQGMAWYTWQNNYYSVKRSDMIEDTSKGFLSFNKIVSVSKNHVNKEN